jgi:hypothetical protein
MQKETAFRNWKFGPDEGDHKAQDQGLRKSKCRPMGRKTLYSFSYETFSQLRNSWHCDKTCH